MGGKGERGEDEVQILKKRIKISRTNKEEEEEEEEEE